MHLVVATRKVIRPTIDLKAISDTGDSSTDNITQDNRLVLTGTAEAGSTVTLMDGNQLLGTVTADKTGRWSFTSGKLDDGSHDLTAVAKIGGEISTSSALTVEIDHVAPARPTIDLKASSDAGTSSTDNLTSDYTPALTGKAERGSGVVIKDGSTVLGTATANSSGVWSFTAHRLAEGRHHLTVTATDQAGNVSKASSALIVDVDKTVPRTPSIDLTDASDTGASQTDNITSDDTQVLTGKAEASSRVTIKDGSTVLGRVTADTSGHWTFTTRALDEGNHQLTVVAADQAGNVSKVSPLLTVKIDQTAPGAPSLDLSDASDTGVSRSDNFTGDTTPTLTGKTEAGATVTIKDGSAILGTATADSSGIWSFTTSTLENGVHNLTAIAADKAGNAASAAAALTITVSATHIDLTTLSESQGFIIQGKRGEETGISVAAAGDVNGDGFDDLIVGAINSHDGGTQTGAAYVVFGTDSGFGTADIADRQVIDLTTLSSAQGFLIRGDTAGDKAGVSVSSAGDINGDGFDDLMVGASGGDDGGDNAGEAYVVFGTASGFGTTNNAGRQVIDLTTLSGSQGFLIRGDAAQDYAGRSVAAAGDVNGDGFDDVVVGAPYGDDGGNNAGEAYVVFGTAAGFGTADSAGRQVIDLSTLSGSQGFIIRGDAVLDYAGYRVSSAGDVNGDGFDDVVVGAPNGDDGGNMAGEAYVVFGTASGFGTADKAGRQVIDLTTLSESQGFVIRGDAANDYAGWSVATAGDVNGDGFDDVIVGAPLGDDRGKMAGEAYVVLGSASGFGTTDGAGRQVIDLTTLSGSQGFVLQGHTASDSAGVSVSSAGDVNGDGFDDLIVGEDGASEGGSDAGGAYVIFGTASGFGRADHFGRQVVELDALTAAEGFDIQGDTSHDEAGFSVGAAGDVNGDGFDDLIIGAPFGDDGGSNAGEAYVIYGSSFGGSITAVALHGTSGTDTLIGSLGDDTIAGGGGADVLIGANGNDTISITDGSFARIFGGGGVDTLAFAGSGVSIDFTAIANNRVSSIERLDLTGSGDNIATLAASDLFHFSDTYDRRFTAAAGDEALVVDGDSGDTLNLKAGSGGWSLIGNDVGLDGSAGGDYDIYAYSASGGQLGFVAVDKDVGTNLI